MHCKTGSLQEGAGKPRLENQNACTFITAWRKGEVKIQLSWFAPTLLILWHCSGERKQDLEGLILEIKYYS